ncbi:MAG: glycosyltransferase [Candidatus Thorarchaeota archaeon]
MRVLVTTSTFPYVGHEYWGNFVESLNTRMEEQSVAIGTVVPRCRCIKRVQKNRLGTIEFGYFWPKQIQTLGCPPGLEHNSRTTQGKIQLPFYLLAFTLSLLVATLRRRPHMIHANWAIPSGLVSWIVGKITSTPVLVTVHGADVYQKGLRKIIIRFVLERVDHVVVVSNHVERLLLQFARPQKLTVIPNAIDVQEVISTKKRINPSEVKKRMNIKPSDVVVLTVRRLVIEKRIVDLVKAAAKVLSKLDNVTFVIGGSGPELENLQNLARDLNIENKVKFFGALTEAEKLELLSIADICVQTSVQEGLSLALLEFMASGAPVIASAAAGQSDMIKHDENGLLFPATDTDALAELIIHCIKKGKSELGEAARKLVVEHHSFEVHTEQYKRVYALYKP